MINTVRPYSCLKTNQNEIKIICVFSRYTLSQIMHSLFQNSSHCKMADGLKENLITQRYFWLWNNFESMKIDRKLRPCDSQIIVYNNRGTISVHKDVYLTHKAAGGKLTLYFSAWLSFSPWFISQMTVELQMMKTTKQIFQIKSFIVC